MALYKPIKTAYGVDATYWRIIEFSVNYPYKLAKIRIAGYVDKNARDNNQTPLELKTFNCNPKEFDKFFNVDVLNELNNNPLQQSYNFIKYNELYDKTFVDAEDI